MKRQGRRGWRSSGVDPVIAMEQKDVAAPKGMTPAKTKDHAGMTSQETANLETQQVCFMLAGGEYAVDISLVKEIIKPTMEPTPVPQSPPFVEGVIDLRGDIIPIIDLKRRFGIEVADGVAPTRILVIRKEDIIVGFLVDSVTEVIRTRNSLIQDAPGKVVGIDNEYIWGVTKRSPDSHLIMLLDIDKVLMLDNHESGRGETAESA